MKPQHFCPANDWDLNTGKTKCDCVMPPDYDPNSVYEDCWAGGFELGEDD